MPYWPDATFPADYLGPTRRPSRFGEDDVVLTWAAVPGRVAMIWRPTDPILLGLAEEIECVDAAVLIAVDPDFGIDGPGVRAINAARPNKQYRLAWRDLARTLGQPIPYWPSALRDPELLKAWQPGAATVTAPARPELDTTVLLRMAAMFNPSHATHRTLENLARIAQHRGTRDACGDLRILDQCLDRFHDKVAAPTTVVAARPLEIGDLDVDADPDDMLFSHPTDVDVTTAAGREWVARLEPAPPQTAAFAHIDADGAGEALTDPATDAPAVRYSDEKVRTSLPQRLPATSELAELILGRPLWVRTADCTLYPLHQSPTYRSSWGYGGGGPGNLAVIIAQLLDDITAEASDRPADAPAGLQALTRLPWPAGTVLNRNLLEAARDGRPYDHPNKPDIDE